MADETDVPEDVRIAVNHDGPEVVIQFEPVPVKWIRLSVDSARELARRIRIRADEVEKLTQS